jgi:hypothetical protein
MGMSGSPAPHGGDDRRGVLLAAVAAVNAAGA